MAQKPRKKKGEKQYTLKDLKTLGQQLLSSRSHVNNLPRLLSFIDPSFPPQYALESLLSLQSFFTPLLPDLPSSKLSAATSSAEKEDAAVAAEFIYRTWLRSKFDVFLSSLITLASSSQSEQALREVALDTIMEFVKIGNKGKFQSAIYHRFLHSIINSSLRIDDMLLDLLVSKYFKYIDVRYFTYISLDKMTRVLEVEDASDYKSATREADRKILSRESMEISIHKIYYLLSNIPPFDGSAENSSCEMWNGFGIFSKDCNSKGFGKLVNAEGGKCKAEMPHDKDSSTKAAKKMKSKFSKAWISFLRLPLPLDVYKEVLSELHQTVIPHLSNPLMLCDFLTRSYDIGGVVSVMALSSLFILMTENGLEYPNFYEKLYALLEPSIFMAKYRARFFQLVDSCLKSPLLPAYLAASFCKRLSRLALFVPPSGALIIIALVHNLLRRHPSINFLVHREDVDKTANETSAEEENGVVSANELYDSNPGIDHFNNEQTDPIRTNAMRSSLWEIDTLRYHYCPPVSRFVLSLENDLTVRSKTSEVAVKDFSSGSYATIFSEEIRRRVKQVPLAFYKATPNVLFSDSDFPGWSFKFNFEEHSSVDAIEEKDHPSMKRQRVE